MACSICGKVEDNDAACREFAPCRALNYKNDEHIVEYYLNNGRAMLAKASNRFMKEFREKELPFASAIEETKHLEAGIQSISEMMWERRTNALMGGVK